mmetsp:Transcript_26285/g.57379  ORF Transcript_26285/g.57379 Transcript_26285/m.57379 type:complete len:92 (+) Transcript_26285:1-276(+)
MEGYMAHPSNNIMHVFHKDLRMYRTYTVHMVQSWAQQDSLEQHTPAPPQAPTSACAHTQTGMCVTAQLGTHAAHTHAHTHTRTLTSMHYHR